MESYRAALADLSFNSKPLINMLTMLAEESEQMAAEIVQVIDDQIEKVFITVSSPCVLFCHNLLFLGGWGVERGGRFSTVFIVRSMFLGDKLVITSGRNIGRKIGHSIFLC